MINAALFRQICDELSRLGWYDQDVAWAESCRPPLNSEEFAWEAIFVICNSGMKNKIAEQIFAKVKAAIEAGNPVSGVFGHAGKAAAIEQIWRERQDWFTRYFEAEDKVEFCGTLPWIGCITKYHLAKNFGADVAKPDVHLKRLADREGVTCQELCERLGRKFQLRAATIDLILWRACAYGVLNSKTGELRTAA